MRAVPSRLEEGDTPHRQPVGYRPLTPAYGWTVAAWLTIGAGAGCASRKPPVPASPLTPPTELCTQPAPPGTCRTSAEIVAWLRYPDLRILGVADPPRGKQGAKVLTLAVPGPQGPVVFRAKWRAETTASPANVPRHELAAYAVQRLFLDPDEYVVPPAAAHCFELEEYRTRVSAKERPWSPGYNCVFGYLSYWLEDAVPIKEARDEGWFRPEQGPLDSQLFASNAVYRQAVSSLNLLLFLIDQGDRHGGQFLVHRDRRRPVVYGVDNSMAFGSGTNPRLDRFTDWSRIQVPMAQGKLARLAAWRPADVAALGVIEQSVYRDGRLWPVPVETAAVLTDAPGRRWGDVLQIGLTRAEIDQLWTRSRVLLRNVARGLVPTY